MAIRPPRAGFSLARKLAERARAQSGAEAPPAADLPGLGNMLDSLRSVIEKFAEAAKADHPETETSNQGAHHVTLGGQSARMVFGYTVRLGEHGLSAERFGDTPEAAPPKAAARQPIAELYEEGETIIVVAELPGADPESITCTLTGTDLLMEATGRQAYRKTLCLPGPARPETLQTSFQNGILEVRLTRATAP